MQRGLTTHGVPSDEEWPAREVSGSLMQGGTGVAVDVGGCSHEALVDLAVHACQSHLHGVGTQVRQHVVDLDRTPVPHRTGV